MKFLASLLIIGFFVGCIDNPKVKPKRHTPIAKAKESKIINPEGSIEIMKNDSVSIRIKLKMSLEEMYAGVTKKIKYARTSPCDKCEKGCLTCGNRGFVMKPFITEITIPAGVDSLMTLSFKGKGNLVLNNKKMLDRSTPNHSYHNLDVVVAGKVHDLFQREGADLIYKVRVSSSELTLNGKQIEFKHLNSDTIKLVIPKGTKNGKILRIKGLGFKNLSDGSIGNLLVYPLVNEKL